MIDVKEEIARDMTSVSEVQVELKNLANLLDSDHENHAAISEVIDRADQKAQQIIDGCKGDLLRLLVDYARIIAERYKANPSQAHFLDLSRNLFTISYETAMTHNYFEQIYAVMPDAA